MLVHIRKDGYRHLAYFTKSRRVLELNDVGAEIANLFFNEEQTIEDISSILSAKYKQTYKNVYRDVVSYFQDLEHETRLGGFNAIQEQEQLDVPLGVELEITRACNLRCIHCLQEHHENKSMPLQQAVQIINTLARSGVFEINIIGGEPFKHPYLFEILRHCASKEIMLTLVTNGTLINKHNVSQIKTLKNLVLAVSIDGIGPIHNEIRGKKQFARVDKTLRLLIENKIPVEALCTLNSLNLPTYGAIVEYCENLNIPCNFNLFKPTRPEHWRLTPNPVDVFRAIIDMFELRSDKGYRIGLSNAAITAELLNLPNRNECKAAKAGLVIDVNGKMTTCPLLVSTRYYNPDKLPEFNNDYVNTWHNHPIFKRFRNGNMLECQARAYIFSNSVDGNDPYGINTFRAFRKNYI